MTDQTSTEDQTTTADEQPDATDVEQSAGDPAEHTSPVIEDEPEPQSKREARYRTQLRETEGQRDQLAAQIEAMQRTEVERLAADVIAKPDALWASETTLPDLLDDDGMVDPAKVAAAARTAQKALGLELGGLARKKKGPIVPKEGTSYHGSSHGSSWAAAFK